MLVHWPLESMVMPPGPAFFFCFVGLARYPWPLWSSPRPCARSCVHRGSVAVVHVGLVAVDQVQILHGVVVIGAIVHGHLRYFRPSSTSGAFCCASGSITFLGAFTLPLPSSLRPAACSAFSLFSWAFGPVDHADGIGRLGILGIDYPEPFSATPWHRPAS